MYSVHLTLIGKSVVDFLLVIIELFSFDSTAEALRANIDWTLPFSQQQGQLGPKILGRRGRPPPSFFVSENFDICSFIWYKICAEVSFVLFCFSMRLSDGRTEGRTDGQLSQAYRVWDSLGKRQRQRPSLECD